MIDYSKYPNLTPLMIEIIEKYRANGHEPTESDMRDFDASCLEDKIADAEIDFKCSGLARVISTRLN